MRPPPNPPPLRPSILTDTSPRVYPLQGTASLLAHCPESNSDTYIGWGGERSTLYKGVETSPYRRVLKTLKGSPKRKAQREQYLLAMGLGRYIKSVCFDLSGFDLDFRDKFLNALNGFGHPSSRGLFIDSCYAHCQTEMQETWLRADSPKISNTVN